MIVLVFLMTLGYFVLSRANTPSSALEQQVRDFEEKFNGAYAANDLPTYFSYYASDCSQWLPQGRTDLPTYQKNWTHFIQSGGRVESATLSDVHIQIGPSEDTAVASYILHVRTRDAKGEASEEDNQETDVLFKRGGVWKVVFLHYSPVPIKRAQEMASLKSVAFPGT
jgi:ketosteroid isomerase-like protein